MDSSVPELVLGLIEDLPFEHIAQLAALLEKESALNEERLIHLLKPIVPKLETQERIRQFVERWAELPYPPSPHEMAMLFEAVGVTLNHQRGKQKIDLVWTGPKTRYINLRRTDRALIELIESAHHKLTVVSFAVYKAHAVLSALERAAVRGVETKIILESPDASEGKVTFDAIHALSPMLRERSKIFIWPYAKRMVNSDGKIGSLHAKCAVADSNRLFVSSANLTDFAMNLNMEIGISLQDENLPAQVDRLFEELIAQKILSEVTGVDE